MSIRFKSGSFIFVFFYLTLVKTLFESKYFLSKSSKLSVLIAREGQKFSSQNPTFGMMQWHFEVIWGWFEVTMWSIEDGCGRSWIILKNIFFNKRRCFRQTMNWDKIKNFFRKRTQHCFNWDINRVTSFWQIQDNRTSFSMLRIMYKQIN